MKFTLEHVINSLGDILKNRYPDYPVYDSPNQQGETYPCFFIFFMPSTMDEEVGNRFIRDLGVDIVFVQQRNIVNGHTQMHEVADYLDEVLGLFLYLDGNGEEAFIRTYERQWQYEDQELHYQFHIRERMGFSEQVNPMREMETNYGIKE